MSSPCEEYYRQRSCEIVTQLAKWSQSAVVRDETFVRLLRAKVERRAHLADAVAQVSRKAVAETRHALVANNDRAAAALDKAAAELEEFADGLWRVGDDGGGVTADELDDVNARLREVVKLKREALEKAVAVNKAAGERLRQEQAANDRIAHSVTVTADCHGPPADRLRQEQAANDRIAHSVTVTADFDGPLADRDESRDPDELNCFPCS